MDTQAASVPRQRPHSRLQTQSAPGTRGHAEERPGNSPRHDARLDFPPASTSVSPAGRFTSAYPSRSRRLVRQFRGTRSAGFRRKSPCSSQEPVRAVAVRPRPRPAPRPAPEISPFLARRMRSGDARKERSARGPVGGASGALRRSAESAPEQLSLRVRDAFSAERLAPCAVLAAFWEVEFPERGVGWSSSFIRAARHRWSGRWEPPKRQAADKVFWLCQVLCAPSRRVCCCCAPSQVHFGARPELC